MKETISKKEVLEKLFNSYIYGNLGMFIGAGFSKAITVDSTSEALGWNQLIEKVSINLNIDLPDNDELIGVSLPELATIMCKKLESSKGIEYEEAKRLFKNEVSNLTNWLPSEKKTKEFRELFDGLGISWIITTNYDQVLETILTGNSKSLSPTNYFSAPKNVIPIYHLHGTRLDSDSIIITQDDYLPLFRPNEYRQTKLAMTIRESTTLIMGYGLGDVNVLSAVDWSKNIYTEENEYPHEIIQALWSKSPNSEAYRDENGNIIYEIEDIEAFLVELKEYIEIEQEKYDERIQSLEGLIGTLESENEELIEKFINDEKVRLGLIELIAEFEYHMISPYINFLTICMDRVWEKTDVPNAFEMYDKYLNIIFDILINFDYYKMSPRLFQLIAQSMNKVLNYVTDGSGRTYGNSWIASRSWNSRKKNIPTNTIKQMYHYSVQNNLFILEDRLNNLEVLKR